MGLSRDAPGHPKYRGRLEKNKRWRTNNPEYWKDKYFQRNYGITLETYKEMLEAQNYSCAICGTHEDELTRKLHVDHCHQTGSVRKLLCHGCNTGIGALKDDPELLMKAYQYLMGG